MLLIGLIGSLENLESRYHVITTDDVTSTPGADRGKDKESAGVNYQLN